MVEIGGFMALTGGGWPPDQRQEFIQQTLMELADIPVCLVLPVLATARRKIYQPARFVSWIWEQVEDDMTKLRIELERLEQLSEAAAG